MHPGSLICSHLAWAPYLKIALVSGPSQNKMLITPKQLAKTSRNMFQFISLLRCKPNTNSNDEHTHAHTHSEVGFPWHCKHFRSQTLVKYQFKSCLNQLRNGNISPAFPTNPQFSLGNSKYIFKSALPMFNCRFYFKILFLVLYAKF